MDRVNIESTQNSGFKLIYYLKKLLFGIKDILVLIFVSIVRTFKTIVASLIQNSNKYENIESNSKQKFIKLEGSVVLKNFLYLVDEKQKLCINFLRNNLLRLFMIILFFIFIFSFITGVLETRTRGSFKSFIRGLPSKLAVLLIFLKICNSITIFFLSPSLLPSLTTVVDESKSFFIILAVLIFSYVIFNIKPIELLDFYSICSYSLFVHISIILKMLFFSTFSYPYIFKESLVFSIVFIFQTLIGYTFYKFVQMTFDI